MQKCVVSFVNLIFIFWLICIPYFADPCKKQTCDFNSKCLRRNDNKAQCVCQICPKGESYTPVCGNNGKTYATQCELERSSCEQKQDIKAVKEEACGELLGFMICLWCLLWIVGNPPYDFERAVVS